MKRLLANPSALLLATGSLIGLNFPLGKIAAAAGVSPLLWAALFSAGAAAFLLPYLVATRRLALPDLRLGRYAVVSGLITFVAANVLTFAVIPHVGAGYTGLVFALSPVFTLAIAGLVRLRTPGPMGLAGIACGLLGAAMVTLTRHASPEVAQPLWLLVALLIPLTLASGNVYRTVAWPQDASPDVLAFWSHLAAASTLVVLMLVVHRTVPVGELARVPEAALWQAIVAGATFPLFFRLQRLGGPVTLSQIGYVAAAVGLLAATLVLGESYSLVTWAGAAVIAVGIGLTIAAQS